MFSKKKKRFEGRHDFFSFQSRKKAPQMPVAEFFHVRLKVSFSVIK